MALKPLIKKKSSLLKTFGANKWQILNKVVLPSSLPTIINALKINVGLSWVGVIVGEFLGIKGRYRIPYCIWRSGVPT